MTENIVGQRTETIAPIPHVEVDVPDVFTSGDYSSNEPLDIAESEGIDLVLDSLGIESDMDSLTNEDKENHATVRKYVEDAMNKKGLKPTVGNFKKTMDEVMMGMGIDSSSEPSAIMDRIAGVVKSWESLSFVDDIPKKRALFMELAKLGSSKDMNKAVLRAMEKLEIWK